MPQALRKEDRFDELVETMSTLSWAHPFWATLIYDQLSIVIDDSVGTLGVGGGKMYISPTYFIGELTPGQRVFALAHETSHEMFCHPAKMQAYLANGFDGEAFDTLRYNMAADYYINDMLIQWGVGDFKQGWLHHDAFKYEPDVTVEDFYRRLKPKERPAGKGDPQDDGQSDGGQGGGSPTGASEPGHGSPGSETHGQQVQYDMYDSDGKHVGETPTQYVSDKHMFDEESPSTELEWKTAVAGAAEGAKSIGKGSAFMDRFVDEYIETKRPWQLILRDYIQPHRGRDRRNPKKLRKRHMYQYGIAVPTKHSWKIGDIMVVEDVSGSVSRHESNVYRSCLAEIFTDCRPKSIRIMCCASDVIDGTDEVLTNAAELEQYQPKGTGGTDMEAAFRHVLEDGFMPEVCIVLTDGYTAFDNEPPFPVIWVTTGYTDIPYGRVVEMDDVT